MNQNGLFQWDKDYPSPRTLSHDILQGDLYGIVHQDRVIAAISLNIDQDKNYANLPWEITEGTQLVVHRLAVHPQFLGQGLGQELMAFAEDMAKNEGHSAIRLDTFTENPHALALYDRLGYRRVSEMSLDYREGVFMAFEKAV